MGKGSLFRFVDTRELFRLMADVRACPQVDEQGRVLIDGLCRLIGADVGWFAEVEQQGQGFRPISSGRGSVRDVTMDRFMASWGQTYPIEFDAMATTIVSEARPAFVTHWTRVEQVLPLRNFGPFLDLLSSIRVGDMLDPCFSLRPGHFFAINLQRRQGKRFNQREVAMVQLAAEELRWMAQTGRLTLSKLSRQKDGRELPPRLQQVLSGLLVGQSPKAIAASMNLSLWTVREHIQRLYRHFGVNGREELMARFLRP